MPTIQIDSIDYHYLLEGPQNRPIILLIHALMSNLHMWDSTVRALNAANYQTLRFDHIGHNLTPPPSPTDSSSQPYTTETITHHMHTLVEQTTGQSHLKAVIGCSIGGVLALRYSMLYPSSVQTTISLCAPGIKSLEKSKPLWTQRIQQFEIDQRESTDTLCRATVDRWLPGDEPHDEAVRAEALGHVRTCSLEGYRVLADAIRGYDYSGELGKLEGVRCVVVAGGRDGAVDVEVLRDLAARIHAPRGGARFVLMEDAGHIPPMHRAEEFEALVLEALEEA
jgi:pimeloyl-ACP methyl ester carboxylesterase